MDRGFKYHNKRDNLDVPIDHLMTMHKIKTGFCFQDNLFYSQILIRKEETSNQNEINY